MIKDAIVLVVQCTVDTDGLLSTIGHLVCSGRNIVAVKVEHVPQIVVPDCILLF